MQKKVSYEDNLKMILEASGGKRLLSITETAKILGICYNTTRRRYPFKDGYISAAVLARELS